MNAKEILLKVKALFEAPIVNPPIATVPIIAAVAPTDTPFKLKDGTDITIGIEDPTVSTAPDAGDIVKIGGIPAPAGDYELEDGTTLTVDGTGAIIVITAIEPVTQPEFVAPPEAPAAKTLEERAKKLEEKIAGIEARISAFEKPTPLTEVPTTIKGIHALYAAFAVGTPEERIANLEMVAKALMEATFGWQLREAEQKASADQAMTIYKQGLIATPAQMEKHEVTIKGLFELVEKLVDEPASDPVTLTGIKKDQFERQNAQGERLKRIAEQLKKNKALA